MIHTKAIYHLLKYRYWSCGRERLSTTCNMLSHSYSWQSVAPRLKKKHQWITQSSFHRSYRIPRTSQVTQWRVASGYPFMPGIDGTHR